MTDAATPLLDEWVAPQEDLIAPALTNPLPIIGPVMSASVVLKIDR